MPNTHLWNDRVNSPCPLSLETNVEKCDSLFYYWLIVWTTDVCTLYALISWDRVFLQKLGDLSHLDRQKPPKVVHKVKTKLLWTEKALLEWTKEYPQDCSALNPFGCILLYLTHSVVSWLLSSRRGVNKIEAIFWQFELFPELIWQAYCAYSVHLRTCHMSDKGGLPVQSSIYPWVSVIDMFSQVSPLIVGGIKCILCDSTGEHSWLNPLSS